MCRSEVEISKNDLFGEVIKITLAMLHDDGIEPVIIFHAQRPGIIRHATYREIDELDSSAAGLLEEACRISFICADWRAPRTTMANRLFLERLIHRSIA